VHLTTTRRVAVLAGLGGLLFGYDTGVIGGAQLFIEKQFHLSSLSDEVLVSCVLVGAIFGALLSGRILERWGRRAAITAAGTLFILGSVAAAASPTAWFLDAARIVVGIGIGVVSVAAPLYVAETAPADKRGSMVALYQLAITVGIFMAYLVDEWFAADEAWRAMFAIGVIPAVLLVVGVRTLPESPRWLVDRGRRDEARVVLETLGDDTLTVDVDAELATIDAAAAAAGDNKWRAAFSRGVRPALVIAVGLALIQQLTGINTVMYYAPTIFQDAGMTSSTAAIWASVTVSIVNMASTFIAIRYVDRKGRRPLLVIGLIGMTAALVALAAVFALGGSGGGSSFDAQDALTVGALWVYVCFFAFSLGPIVWIVISEIFPASARGPGNSIATMAGWGGNLLVSLTFLSLIDLLGDSGTFLLYGVISIASIFFVLRLVPETRGRTLEQIEAGLVS
jgi:MFS transporter, SP family, galactose:H+ symporter